MSSELNAESFWLQFLMLGGQIPTQWPLDLLFYNSMMVSRINSINVMISMPPNLFFFHIWSYHYISLLSKDCHLYAPAQPHRHRPPPAARPITSWVKHPILSYLMYLVDILSISPRRLCHSLPSACAAGWLDFSFGCLLCPCLPCSCQGPVITSGFS